MRKRIVVVCVVFLLLVCGMLAISYWGPAEPVYQGRPLSFWIDSLDATGSTSNRWESLGTNTIPVLLMALQKQDSQGQAMYRRTFKLLPIWASKRLPKLAPEPVHIRMGAGVELIEMSEESRTAIPKLIEIFTTSRDFQVRRCVATVLFGVGKGDQRVKAS